MVCVYQFKSGWVIKVDHLGPVLPWSTVSDLLYKISDSDLNSALDDMCS